MNVYTYVLVNVYVDVLVNKLYKKNNATSAPTRIGSQLANCHMGNNDIRTNGQSDEQSHLS